MQYFQTGFSDSWQEGYEQNWEAEHAHQKMFDGSQIDLGEKSDPLHDDGSGRQWS